MKWERVNCFFDVVASLDGFIAPEGMDLTHADDPDFKQWLSQWTKLQSWGVPAAVLPREPQAWRRW